MRFYVLLFCALTFFPSYAYSFSCNASGQATQFDTIAGTTCTTQSPPTQSGVTRTLNACFQPSATKVTNVVYSVNISTSLSLTTGQVGTVFLEMSDDNACSVNTQELSEITNGQTGALTVGLGLTQSQTMPSIGLMVPAGKWLKIRTSNVTGTPTFAYKAGQEVVQP